MQVMSNATKYGLAGAVVAGTGILSAVGKLPRNIIAGIRIPSTMHSDEAWRAGHKAAAAALTVSGLGPVAVALVVRTLGPDADTEKLLARIGEGWLLGWVAVATLQARRAARAVQTK